MSAQSMSLNEEAKKEMDVCQWLRMDICFTSKEFTGFGLVGALLQIYF